MVSHLKHLSMVNAVCWFPFGLLVIERAFKEREGGDAYARALSLLWLGPIFGLQHLTGHTQAAYYAGLVYCVYFLFRLTKFQKERGSAAEGLVRRILGFLREPLFGWFVAAMCGGALIGGLQLLPTYELVSNSQRIGGVTYSYATHFTYDLHSMLTFVYPFANGDVGTDTYNGRGIFWEEYGYVGLFTIILAFSAMIRERKNWYVRFFALTAIVAFLIVLGNNTPFFRLAFEVVPGMRFFRFPSRLLFVVDYCLVILAGFSVSGFEASFQKRGARAFAVIIVAVVAADLLFFQLRQNGYADLDSWRTPPRTAEFLKKDTTLFRIHSPGASVTHQYAFTLARGWSGDVQPYIAQREFLQPSLNVLYGLSSADGYAQLTPSAVVDIWGDQNVSGLIDTAATIQNGVLIPHASFIRIMDVSNVKYLLSPWPIQSDALVGLGRIGDVSLYGNPGVLPRAFVVGRFRLASDTTNAESLLLGADFDPREEVVLFENPIHSPSGTSGGTALIRRYSTNEVVVEVQADAPGLLVLLDTFYPGWAADVDGEAVRILRANVCQRAVSIPAGHHVVTFRFKPVTVILGLAMTICGIVVIGSGMAFARSRRGRKDAVGMRVESP
jgi:hypothetical protein